MLVIISIQILFVRKTQTAQGASHEQRRHHSSFYFLVLLGLDIFFMATGSGRNTQTLDRGKNSSRKQHHNYSVIVLVFV